MKKLIFSLATVLMMLNICYSQDFSVIKGAEICSMKKSKIVHPERYYTDSPGSPVHSFDVLNYKLVLDIYRCYFSPYPKNFVASNVITFRVDSTLNNIKLNANNTSLTIDSVRFLNGAELT